MQIRFNNIVLSTGVIAVVIIYLLSLRGWVTPEHEIYIRFILLGLFIVGVAAIIINGAKRLGLFSREANKGHTLLVISFTVLLIGSIFHSRIGIYATALFIGAALIYLIFNKKLYRPNKTYYFLFAYTLLLFAGTIGTPRGFWFPDKAYSFVLIPLAFCFFRLSQATLLRIAYLFFRAMIIYMAICVVYWFYNFLYLDVNMVDWITQKLFFEANFTGWDKQVELSGGYVFSAFYFVTSWAYYFHPSYISLVLFCGLIIGFYLYQKKEIVPLITKSDILLYAILCLCVEALMESRIGFVCYCFILATAGLYYAKLRTRHFSTIAIFYFLSGCTLFLLFNDLIRDFIHDDIRSAQYTLGINYIKEHFWWGAGFHEQRAALEYQIQKTPDLMPLFSQVTYYVHNQFLSDMVQYGIWGLLFLVAMLYAFIRYAVKERSYLLQMFLCVFIIFMMIEAPFYIQTGITRFSVFLAFFMAVSESEKEVKSFDIGNYIARRKKRNNKTVSDE